MNLRDLYNKETGCSARYKWKGSKKHEYEDFEDDYVEWLEDKFTELTKMKDKALNESVSIIFFR